MTELSIRPEEIRDALDGYVRSFNPGAASREEVGRVTDAGDGIAHVEGLPSAMTNELLEFEDGTLGLALNLERDSVGAVVLGDYENLREGDVAYFAAGSWAVWDIEDHVQKIAFCRRAFGCISTDRGQRRRIGAEARAGDDEVDAVGRLVRVFVVEQIEVVVGWCA